MANPSSLSNQSKYDVFLSFRGEDTRKTFVDHLYTALDLKGIATFKDDDKIEDGASSCRILEESRFWIIVFSKSYASSSWCLDELVKIMNCSKENRQHVLPVYYYDFNPSNLRRQGPVFGELFAKSEMEKVRAWTSVLVEAANLNGVGLIDYRYQAKHIKEIVDTVLNKLNISKLNHNQNEMGKKHDTFGDTNLIHERLVGMERRVQQVKDLLQAETVKTTRNHALVSSSPRSSWRTYDVFMSFKADDTCKDFTDQLHCALEQHNKYVYRNDQALVSVESNNSEFLTAIEETRIAIVVLSENYAASSRCLDELVKILSCNETTGQMVFPIFYNVDSSDVRYQKGLFGEAFMRGKPEKLEIWRKALVKACSLAGWYLNGTPKSDEATVIESIVDVISSRLDWLPLSVDDNLIGMKTRVKQVTSLLKLESDDVHVVGIIGMGGLGKTTLARTVFDQISTCFDGSCFVKNIRLVSKSHGLKHIQREILSRLLDDENLHVRSSYEEVDRIKHLLAKRKVLIVLDDINNGSQLEALVGFSKWFGEGSRIIITTRDETLLVAHNIKQTYYLKPLDDYESYQLLRRYAFKRDDSTKAYEELFPQVVSYAAGVPLALKVLSSLLCDRSKKEWISTLARLQVCPEKTIQDTLKISYDSLEGYEKEIFLHIACFFNDKDKDYAVKIFDSCGLPGDTGIRVLEQKSLVSISEGKITMHNLIAQLGREIVRQMHPDEPGKRSRLWRAEKDHILIDKMGMKKIDGIAVDDMHDYSYDAVDMTKSFKSMMKLTGPYRNFPDLRFRIKKDPLPSLPKSIEGNELGGSISEPWSDTKFLRRLLILNLSYSRKLIKTHDFTGTPNLKELKLEYCTRLVEVHASIGYLHKLKWLSLRSCRELQSLPRSISRLESLKVLDLSLCPNLESIPKLSGCSDLKLIQLPLRLFSPMMQVLSSIDILRDLVELDLCISSSHSLKLRESYGLHDTLLDIVRRSSSAEGVTSHEMVEYIKKNIPLLIGKVV